jgi:hypothetical protein
VLKFLIYHHSKNMTNAQPQQPNSRLDNLVTITEHLVQTAEIHQQSIGQLIQLQASYA